VKSVVFVGANFHWVMKYCKLLLKFVEHIQATSRYIMVYFPIIFHGGCKFIIEGYPQKP